MPSIEIFGFYFFFWSNEFIGGRLEPLHIHVSKGAPSKDAPKWWINKNGEVMLARDYNFQRYGIKDSDITTIEKIIHDNYRSFYEMWANHFIGENIEFKDF